jgi:hypothetical protein
MPFVKLPDTGKGVNLDLTPEELAPGIWSACQNMRFVNGYAQRFNGTSRIFAAPTVTPYYITPYLTPTKRWWIHAGTGKAFADDGTTRTEITRRNTLALTSITYVTTTATVTTTAAHGLTTGNSVTVVGATPTAYNGTFTITVTGANTFTYTMASNPGANATITSAVLYTTANDYTGARDNRWSGGVFGGVLVMNNGVDVPQYWAGDAHPLRTLTGWDSNWRAQVVVPFKSYLVALDITKSGTRYGSMVKWSAEGVPGSIPSSWDATDVTKNAGENDLAETPDTLVDALPLGDALIIYKQFSMYAMRFIGGDFIFQFQKLPGESGMLFRGCGANTPLGHVVLTAGDVVINNGQGVQSIADGQIRRYIFSNIDSTNYQRAFVTTNPQRNEVLVCFPEVGQQSCTKAAVWNWKDKTWGLRDLVNANYGATGLIENVAFSTWADDTETWEIDSTTWNENAYSPNEYRLLFAENSRISAFDVSSSDDGTTPLPGVLERTGMPLDDASIVKLIRAVYARIDAPSGAVITYQVGGAMYPDSPTTWSSPVQILGGQAIKADCFASGRFLGLRISCSAPWRMRSVDLDAQPMGAF